MFFFNAYDDQTNSFKANELKIIVTTKIDFKMMIKNHNGIMQGKYIKEVNEPDLLSMFDFD